MFWKCAERFSSKRLRNILQKYWLLFWKNIERCSANFPREVPYFDIKWATSLQKPRDLHYVQSVSIRSYSGPHFPAFGLNKKRYSVSLGIQSACGKMRTRVTPNMDTYYALLTCFLLHEELDFLWIQLISSNWERSHLPIFDTH